MHPDENSPGFHPSYPGMALLDLIHLLLRLEEECMSEPWNERMIEGQLKRPAQLVMEVTESGRIRNLWDSMAPVRGLESKDQKQGASDEMAIAGYIWLEDRSDVPRTEGSAPSHPEGNSSASDIGSPGLSDETQWELLRIGVLPGHRQAGLARKLIEAALNSDSEKGPARVLLEVAESNEPARRLYESCGFLEIHRRKNYYLDSDALIMERKERTNET